MNLNPDTVFAVFAATWVVLGIFTFAYFIRGNDAKRKKKHWPAWCVFVGALFVIFAWLMGFPGQAFVFIIPFSVLIIYMNIKANKFCSKCGKMQFNQNPFSKQIYCAGCAAPLE